MRVLHFADVHLDRPWLGMPIEEARARRRGLRDAFDRCLEVAVRHQADAVTIAGDLWEEEHVSPDTCRWVADRLGALARPVVMVAGNHDPIAPGGVYERTIWPDNVTVLPVGRLAGISLGQLSVWGMSWGRAPLTAAALNSFRVPPDGRIHLLLLHGTAVQGDTGGRDHCPFTPEAVSRAGFSLCLAGHIHRAGTAGGVVYPGSPEPLHWGEDGRHAVALVETAPGRPAQVRLIDVNQLHYRQVVVDCHGAASSAEVERRLLDAVRLAAAGREEDLHLRAELRGRVHPDCRPDPAALRRGVGAALALLEVRDATEPAFDVEAYARQPTLLGEFVRDMRRRTDRADGEDEVRALELGLQLGLRALHGDDLSHAA